MNSIYQRQFSASEVAAAAGIKGTTLQNWLKRGSIVGHRTIEGGGSQGKHRRFSWFNVMEIATAAALVRIGVADLTSAFNAAQSFAHSAPGGLPGTPDRHPAMPFDVTHGRTLLFVAGERSQVVPYKPGSDVLALIRSELLRPEAFVVVDLLDLFGRACSALGLDPQELMDHAYSEAEVDD